VVSDAGTLIDPCHYSVVVHRPTLDLNSSPNTGIPARLRRIDKQVDEDLDKAVGTATHAWYRFDEEFEYAVSGPQPRHRKGGFKRFDDVNDLASLRALSSAERGQVVDDLVDLPRTEQRAIDPLLSFLCVQLSKALWVCKNLEITQQIAQRILDLIGDSRRQDP
jgi:hypothetical protein